MNRRFVFLVLSVFFILLAAQFAAAADDGDRVCIYKNEKFRGHEQCYRPGDEVSDLKHAEISSIRVFGHARALLYENRDFRGRMMDFSADIPDLKRVWDKDNGSLRVIMDYASNRDRVYEPDRAYGRYKPYASSGKIDEGVCVYERPDYQGRSQCWGSGTKVSDLTFGNWGDRISSVRVFGHARLAAYRDPSFHGERILIDHDVPDLAGNWNHAISSVEVQ